jgi:hypothetical protein
MQEIYAKEETFGTSSSNTLKKIMKPDKSQDTQ